MGQKKSILIIGSSGGIGAALVQSYQAQGHTVRRLSRRGDGFDLADPASIDAHMSALKGPFDMIVMATGALVVSHAPEKTIKQVEAGAMMDQFAVNAMGPALVLGHAARLLPRERRAVFAVLSARVGSIGDNRLGGWISYRSAKAALNQIIKTAAIELSRSHPQSVVLALHPGTVQTPLTREYLGRHPAVAPAQAAQNLMTVIAESTPADTGGFFDWAGARVPW